MDEARPFKIGTFFDQMGPGRRGKPVQRRRAAVGCRQTLHQFFRRECLENDGSGSEVGLGGRSHLFGGQRMRSRQRIHQARAERADKQEQPFDRHPIDQRLPHRHLRVLRSGDYPIPVDFVGP